MTKTEAIAIARDRIRICPLGRGYVIHSYQPKVGTRVSHEMPWSAAVASAKGAAQPWMHHDLARRTT